MARQVSGTLKDPNGSLLTGVDITFSPSGFLGSGGILILPQPETVTTDVSGNYTVSLATGIRYRCSIKNAVFDFDLDAGASTSLDALL